MMIYMEKCNLPYTLAKHEFATLLVNPNMEWKFYFNS